MTKMNCKSINLFISLIKLEQLVFLVCGIITTSVVITDEHNSMKLAFFALYVV